MVTKPLLYKFLIGLILPFLGLFVGLQVSPWLANILMFPIIAVSALMDLPLGEMPSWMWVGMLLLSGIVWAALLSVPGYFLNKKTNSDDQLPVND
jgi:phosphotransferase system  glucose/maltose/N-acetylglucosamine-specific IIC component